jgi:hypothetical protein
MATDLPGAAGLSVNRLAPAADPNSQPKERLRAQATVRFLKCLQEDFDNDLIGDAHRLGAKFPIAGANFGFDLAQVDSQILPDRVIDHHVYWDLPPEESAKTLAAHNVPEATFNILRTQGNFKTLCEAMIASHRVAGCAMISSENDAPWPHEWRSGHMMFVGASAAHQQLDAIFQFSFHGGCGTAWTKPMAFTSIYRACFECNDPAMVSSFMAGAFLYLRGDVAPAKSLVRYEVEPPENLSSGNWWWISMGNFPANYVPFVSRFEILFKDNPTPAVARADVVLKDHGGSADASEKRARELDAQLKAQGAIPKDTGIGDGRLTSDTGEIVRDWKNQISTVNTPKSQGFSGFPGPKPIELKDASFACSTIFATMQISSLDNQPIAASKRMLLIAAGRADNKEGKVHFASTKPTPSGALRGEGMSSDVDCKGPVVIEPVVAAVTLKAGKLRVTPLKGDMTPNTASAWEVAGKDGQAVIEIGKTGISAWYLVERMP